jgi:hypothetical protein
MFGRISGLVCQNCHMPDRRHHWRGIHDPDMVRSGLSVRHSVDAQGGRFEITNTGVGHAFPTYVTPKVIMHAVALDSAGSPQLSGACFRAECVIMSTAADPISRP